MPRMDGCVRFVHYMQNMQARRTKDKLFVPQLVRGVTLCVVSCAFDEYTNYTGGGGGVLICCWLSHLTIDHAYLSRRSTVPTPNRDTSNVWALILLFFDSLKMYNIKTARLLSSPVLFRGLSVVTCPYYVCRDFYFVFATFLPPTAKVIHPTHSLIITLSK